MKELLSHLAMLETPDGFIKIKDKDTYRIAQDLLREFGKRFLPKNIRKDLRKLEKLTSWNKTELKKLAQKSYTKKERGRGRPKGSKNKKKEVIKVKVINPEILRKKAENHIVKKEPFETTQEFKQRKKEEMAEQK